jgi:hypothetical protein
MKARSLNVPLIEWLHSLIGESAVPNMVYPALPGSVARPSCRIPRLRDRDGKCHLLAANGAVQALLAGDEWDVVSGLVDKEPGRPMVHSWLRQAGVVYEPVLDKCYVNELSYWHAVNFVEVVSYTASEIARLMKRDSAYGPWWPQLPEDQLPIAMRAGSPFRSELQLHSTPPA